MQAKLYFLVLLLAHESATETVWPLPYSLTCKGPPVPLSPDFSIESPNDSTLLLSAINRYRTIIKQSLSTDGWKGQQDTSISSLLVTVESADETLNSKTSYEYWVNVGNGIATVKGTSVYAAMYGMETFSQLVVNSSLECLTVVAHDFPRYRHRGLMIDTGRRFFPIPLVFALLDAMSYVKMNVLHMHLSDFCRFSVESLLYPELTAGLKGQYYTHENISAIVQYAKERGIRVMPEIDLPGHSKGLEPLSSSHLLKYCDSESTEIYDDPQNVSLSTLQKLLTEMAALFPESLYHLGCDETTVVAECTLEGIRNLEKQLFNFTSGLLKKPVAFEEALFTTQSADQSVIIQTWEHYTALDAVRQGVYAIENSKFHFYLSLEPLIPVKDVWTDIAAKFATDKERSLLLGGEISYWTDDYCFIYQCQDASRTKPRASWMFDADHDEAFSQSVSNMLWPRGIAGAGSFWRYEASLSTDDFLTRYHAQNERLIQRGITSCPNNCTCDVLSRCNKPYKSK
eukprot:m.194898 g.194898  ORF g.194898 m.194898 type:complete len:513 (+) comp39508_c1_seq15:46-1584(+)